MGQGARALGGGLRGQALRATASALTRRREGWEAEFVRESWGYLPSILGAGASAGPTVWISAAPGGELIQSASFCGRLKAASPDLRILLSTTNARSLGFARTVPGTDGVFFSPWDLSGPVRRALRAIRPRLVLAVEAAIAPVLYREARRLGATTALISGYMAGGYQRHPTYARAMALGVFAHLDWIGAKSEEDRRGFLQLGAPPDRVVVLGDLRYDPDACAVPEAERKAWRDLLGLDPDEPLLVAGSVRTGEEALVLDGFLEARRGLPGLRLVIAPRFHPDVERVSAWLRERREPFHRRTELRGGRTAGVIVLDSFGELARLYSLASFVFLGGSVLPGDSVGLGQNLSEPLAQGVPIFFGPHMNRWADIVSQMTAVYPGLRVTGAADLGRGIGELGRSPELVGRLRSLARRVMEERSGGLSEHVAFVRKIVTGGAELARPAS
jgi:3-deoxy-D-manno-octulosonic-acid transferase